MSQDAPRIKLEKSPRSILALGFVSMFMDISSEMIHALLPLYLVTVLGALRASGPGAQPWRQLRS